MRAAVFTIFVVFVPAAVRGQGQTATVALTITPRAVGTSPFRYTLLPPLQEQKDGNAVLLYYRANAPHGFLSWYYQNKWEQRLQKWLELPYADAARKGQPSTLHVKPSDDLPSELPAPTFEDVTGTLGFENVLEELHQAARRTYAEWELLDRVKTNGYYLAVPELNSFQAFSSLLRAKARLEVMNGRHERAVYTLQTGFGTAQHLSRAPLLFTTMLGSSIGDSMCRVIEEQVQTESAPNLYWALSDLPRPLLDTRPGFQGDQIALGQVFPEMNQFEQRVYTPEQMRLLADRFTKMMHQHDLPEQVLRAYPAAKAWLLAQGKPADVVEAMPALQTVVLHARHRAGEVYDEIRKASLLPPAEAFARLAVLRQSFNRWKETNDPGYGLGFRFMEHYPRALWQQVHLDRRIALLRCVEALRHHAAIHQNQFPAAWDDVRDLPVPQDPFTGRPFVYERRGDRARITVAAGPAGWPWSPKETVYEISLRQ